VITVEVYAKEDSGAFHEGRQLIDDTDKCTPLPNLTRDDAARAKKVDRARCNALRTYAEALLTEFLGS
jgi:hypothetical protein